MVLLLAGCSKKEPAADPDVLPAAPPLLKSYKFEYGTQSEISYYTYQDRILESIKSLGPDSGITQLYKTTQVVDSKIKELRYEYRSDRASPFSVYHVIKYEYVQGRLSKRTRLDTTQQQIFDVTDYTYDLAGHIQQVSTNSLFESVLFTTVDNLRCDRRGNVVSGVHHEYRDGKLAREWAWISTYDEKINPRQYLDPYGPVSEYFSPSNITSSKPADGRPGNITSISYVYNAEGYPVSGILKYDFGNESRLSYTY